MILSPGSRCAPLTLAFARHPDIQARTISDERSAAFIALGMAQQLKKPVALVCTSGSAALNYYPAIAEAFFQEIPLLILTADRPSEWIDQFDGQTIFQQDVYGKHVKASYELPDQTNQADLAWHSSRLVNEALNMAMQAPLGPVHINIPLREPFYPPKGEVIVFPENPKVFNRISRIADLDPTTYSQLNSRLQLTKKILVIVGQQDPNKAIQQLLDQLAQEKNVVVVTDTISNLQSEHTISLHDHWLGNDAIAATLKPDLILSFGKSIISKPLKLFLRKCKVPHWHIQEEGKTRDTFQSLTQILPSSPTLFLTWLTQNLEEQDFEFKNSWVALENLVAANLTPILQSLPFGEYAALDCVLKHIPRIGKIHLANSMSVRYINQLGKREQELYCNRGTSGIDGSSSTAVGCTFTTKDPVTLITGDLAFFYDRNAFWHNYTMPNLRIILLNNHAGGIFRLIEGPANQPELEEFFETKQSLTADHLATEFGFFYSKVTTQDELSTALSDFYSPGIHPKILEIETSSPKNAEILKSVKEKIKQILES